MSNPFDESDDEGSQPEVESLKINKSFADKFESQEKRKDLLRAKELLDDDDESDSESEDEDGELITSSLDIEIVKIINKIRKKDPKIYDKTTTWFQQVDADDDDEDDDDTAAAKGEKKKRYKDILREQLLKHGADIEQDGDDESNNRIDNRKSSVGRSTGALAYDDEQQKLRKAFLQSVGDDVGSDGEDAGDMMQVRAKDPAVRAQEELDLKEALSEMRELGAADTEEETEKRDAFLLDYLSKQQWKEKQQYVTRKEAKDDDMSDSDYEENEEELDKVDLFEHKYNFRFEELQGDNGNDEGKSRSNVIGMGLQSLQVIGHARSVEGSVRRVDEKRKAQRDSRKENKEKEKRQKEAELKRLKNLKKQELQERLRQICEVSGLNEGQISEDALDEDWDPEKYEAMMQKQFGDDYYREEENDGGDFGALDDGEGGNDEYEGMDTGVGEVQQEDYEEGNGEDYDDGSADIKGRSTSQSEVVSGMMDELYRLDYEDIVAGIPCRFKYRQVEKEDFGLSADEILQAEDSELNKFVSLKKLSAYSDVYGAGEQAHKVAKKRKRLRVTIKERLQKEAEEAAAKGMEIKGLAKKQVKEENEEEEDGEEGKEAIASSDAGASKKRRRRKLKEEIVPSKPSKPVPELSATDDAETKISIESKGTKSSSESVSSKKSSSINSSGKSSSGKSSSKKDKNSKDDGSELSHKKKKKTSMAPAPQGRSDTSKPSSAIENQQRRASLYK